MATTVLSSTPGGVGGLVRLALPSVPLVNRLPGVRKERGFTPLSFALPARRADHAHVEAYARVCGFPTKDTLPVTYPHLLGFGLHAAVMSSPEFPWPAIGLVHLSNAITTHRPIGVEESLAVQVDLGQPRTHPKGTLLDFVTQVSSGDDVVWESTSTYLRRGPSGPPRNDVPREERPTPAPATGLPWKLPADLGREYAAVSGDHNPIHLYPVTAKALGFPRQIAHGMWSKARCLAAVENRLPDAFTVDVAFRKPILLPSTVLWHHETAGDEQHFRLSRKDGAEHLTGTVTPA
ncbi:MAG: MaoC family dehydratase [Nocardioides sp.]|uniref:MaoC family dehydratase n=1 Tax=Nocardioides sp. TaxID=35761 RepID=UPI003F116ABF